MSPGTATPAPWGFRVRLGPRRESLGSDARPRPRGPSEGRGPTERGAPRPGSGNASRAGVLTLVVPLETGEEGAAGRGCPRCSAFLGLQLST